MAANYKEKILDGIKYLEELTTIEDCKCLRDRLAKATNDNELFLLHQTMREVIVQQTGEGDTSFIVRMKDGKNKTFKNLSEFYASLKA